MQDYIGIDWGTTHRRAYRLDAGGYCVAEQADGDGMLAAKGRFPASLAALLGRFAGLPDNPLVLMAGMVGAAQGWVEAPYLDLDCPLKELPRHLMQVADRSIWIVPGYCSCAGAMPDVMRGEETQLLGAVVQGHADGWFVLPGTHSKWVHLENGRIRRFSTYMTGELYALLSAQGTLSSVLGETQQDDPDAFARGVAVAADGALSQRLFGLRAAVVSRQMPAAAGAAWLSGLLIGTEWQDILRLKDSPPVDIVRVIGTPALAERHARAAALLGVRLEVLDARACFLSALGHIAGHLR